MTRRRPLVVKTGKTLDSLVAERGDFEEWIIRGLGLPREDVDVAAVYAGDALPDAASVAGVVITGSSSMVTDRTPWSERTASWLAGILDSELPVLGICYGHQLIAEAAGGRVAANPLGREIGSIDVHLRDAAEDDPLLAGLPSTLRVQATHLESVVELPRDARWLAASEGDPHQIFAVGQKVWGIQFHPEFDADIVRSYIASRREVLALEGFDADALLADASDSAHGSAILRRFSGLLRRG